VDDVTTIKMKIKSFLPSRSGNKDKRPEWRIECVLYVGSTTSFGPFVLVSFAFTKWKSEMCGLTVFTPPIYEIKKGVKLGDTFG
jgi:hypothetical protein